MTLYEKIIQLATRLVVFFVVSVASMIAMEYEPMWSTDG